MSKYTTQLRWIVEQLSQGLETPKGQQYPNAVYKYIGLSDYPIFDENYRTTLNDMIINHYYFREIGFETAAQFSWYLKRTMREIMPKYNMLYTALLEMNNENPLSDFSRHRNENWKSHTDDITKGTSNTDMGETRKDDNTNSNLGEVNDTSKSTEDGRTVFQDTPMGMLSNSGFPSVVNLDYATNVTYTDNKNNITSKSTSQNNAVGHSEGKTDRNTYNTSHTDRDKDDNGERYFDEYGRNKSLAALVKEFSEDFINIDLMIIDDLNDLFFGLW